jgi:DNA-binding ferritin-like protein
MSDILYRLQALYQFYKSAHWLSKGSTFYQEHLLFERLYSGLDEEMDILVELLISTGEDEAGFQPQIILQESAKLIANFGDTKTNLRTAVLLEEDLLLIIQKIDSKAIPAGLYNHIASIAQSHTSKGYLLHRALND